MSREDGAEMLGDVVVQFEGHAPALGFLHLHHALRQGPQQFLGPFQGLIRLRQLGVLLFQLVNQRLTVLLEDIGFLHDRRG